MHNSGNVDNLTHREREESQVGIIPMAGTKQITLRGAAYSKLRKVMPKRNGLREPTRWHKASKWLKGMHDQGMACNRIKTKLSSGAPSIHTFSSTSAKCLFWSVRRRKLQKAQVKAPRMAEWLSPFKSGWDGLSNRHSADFCRPSSAPFLIGSYENEIVSSRESGLGPRLPSLLLIVRPVTYPLCAYSVYPWQITCMIY